MRHLLLLLFLPTGLVLIAASAAAQATWTRQSPLPYPPQLAAEEIAFSATRGYIVGSSRHLLETTDGGTTWHERALTGPVYNDGGYYGVTFSGPLHGWIVGDNLSWTNSCFRTVDGGATWTPMDIVPNSSWSHVDFVSPSHGWVGAWGALYVTNDGGTTWSPQSFGVVDRVDSLNFLDDNVGLLSAQGALRRTQNGGQTWTTVHAHEAFAIEWLDPTTVIVSTHSSGGPDFARSTDAGLTWQTIQVPGVDLQAPVRVGASSLIAGTPDGDLYRSTDAGSTWSRVWNGGITASMNAGTFTSSTEGFVVESANLILRTHDGGQSWAYASNGFAMEFEDVKMFDAQRGLVAGGGGTILRTQDGGGSWIPSRPGHLLSNGDYLTDLSLVAPSFAFAAGNHGTLVKTLDAGLTWQPVAAPTGYPNGGTGDYGACSFISPTEGWLAGRYLEITHTTDGGATWNQQYVGASSADGVYDLDFADALHGWAVGTFGSGVLSTTNGGVSWSFHAFPTPSPDGRAVDFVDALAGWAAGTNGWIARSTNGGLTWTRQTLPNVAFDTHIDSLHALSASECWAASTDNGRVFHTTNAGSTWTELVTPFHDAYDGYTGIAATTNGDVWVAGHRGAISHFGVANSTVTLFCPGDGSGSPCPCANVGATGHGCANSVYAVGGALSATGVARVAGDTLVLAASDMSGGTCVFLQGSAEQPAVIVDDGLGCVTGSIVRLGARPVASASAAYPGPGDPPISVRGSIPTLGGTRYYQCFYRNVASSFCPPATSNRTNGTALVWTP